MCMNARTDYLVLRNIPLQQYFPVPPQFLQDWPESCRNPEDSAKLAELGRTGTEFSRISAKLEYIFKP